MSYNISSKSDFLLLPPFLSSHLTLPSNWIQIAYRRKQPDSVLNYGSHSIAFCLE